MGYGQVGTRVDERSVVACHVENESQSRAVEAHADSGRVSGRSAESSPSDEPIGGRPNPAVRTDKSPVLGGDRGRVRVLVAHQDREDREMIVRLLERLGCEFEIVLDGRQLIDAVEQQPYGLILIDVPLPGVDGPEAARRVRERVRELEQAMGRRPSLIVAMIAQATPDRLDRCQTSGMDHCLAQPVRGAELVMVLACAIDTVQAEAAAQGGDGPASPA